MEMNQIENRLRPKDLLEGSLGEEIICVLRRRRKLKGKLSSFDQHLNLALTNASRLGEDNSPTENIGRVVVRGDTLVFIVFPESGGEA